MAPKKPLEDCTDELIDAEQRGKHPLLRVCRYNNEQGKAEYAYYWAEAGAAAPWPKVPPQGVEYYTKLRYALEHTSGKPWDVAQGVGVSSSGGGALSRRARDDVEASSAHNRKSTWRRRRRWR